MNEQIIQSIFNATFIASILRVTTPILLPSLGALISGRAGVINIGLEGIMLSSAFTGVVFSAYASQWFGAQTGLIVGPWLGLIMGVIVGILMALILAVFHLRFKADLTLSGIALNILGSAGTVAIMYELTGDRGNTSTLASLEIPFIQLPTWLNDLRIPAFTIGSVSIPSIEFGKFFFDIFSNQSAMTWIAFIAVFVVWFLLYRTAFGMHLRAVGENPSAAESVGIPVQRTRYAALLLSGVLAGLGGIHMSMGYLTLFQRDMTSGRGFIALATPLLGNGTPTGTMIASLIFGLFGALETRLGSLQIPSQLTQMIPYVATVMSLAIYALQTRQTLRVRALRAAEGEGFNAAFWRYVQRLSLLHVLMAMVAVIGIIISVSLFTAPNGFGGDATAHPLGLLTGFVSVALIVLNLPFVRRVEDIRKQIWVSLVATVVSLTVYLGLFLSLFFVPVTAFIIAIFVSLFVWALLGGLPLSQMPPSKMAAA